MSNASYRGQVARWLARPERGLLLGACVVEVLTGWLAVAVALFFVAVLWAAIREWPSGMEAQGQQIRAAVTLALVAGIALCVALAWWVAALILAVAAALAAPRSWIRGLGNNDRRTSTETLGS